MRQRYPGLLGYLELNWSLRLLLHARRPTGDALPVTYVTYLKFGQVARTQFAVDGQIEDGEIPDPRRKLQTDANGPDFLELQRRLLTRQSAFVPRYSAAAPS